MNRTNKASLAALAFCSVIAIDAAAQTYAKSKETWYFTPSVNAFDPDSIFGVNGNGSGFGFSFGKQIDPEWDIQISTKYAHQNGNGANYQQNMIGVDGLYLFNRESVRPFLLLGAGVQHDRLTTDLHQASGYAPYVNAGLGLRIDAGDRWTWQVDFRREQGYLKNDDFHHNRNRNNYLEVGLSYSFD